MQSMSEYIAANSMDVISYSQVANTIENQEKNVCMLRWPISSVASGCMMYWPQSGGDKTRIANDLGEISGMEKVLIYSRAT